MFSWKLKNEKVSDIDRFPEYRNQIDAFLHEQNNLNPTTLTITTKDRE